MAKVAKKRGRPKGSKNKKKTAVVKKVAKKRGRPVGSKNKTTKKKVYDTSTGPRLDRVFMIEDMFYSSTRTDEAKEEYEKAYPGEEMFFKKEWSRVASDVADIMLGKHRPMAIIDDDE